MTSDEIQALTRFVNDPEPPCEHCSAGVPLENNKHMLDYRGGTREPYPMRCTKIEWHGFDHQRAVARAALDGLQYREAWEELLPLFDAWNDNGPTDHEAWQPFELDFAARVTAIRARLGG